MDYFDYHEMRSLILQYRLLSYRINLERQETKPNLFRISQLKKLRATALERVSGYLKKHNPAQATVAADGLQ